MIIVKIVFSILLNFFDIRLRHTYMYVPRPALPHCFSLYLVYISARLKPWSRLLFSNLRFKVAVKLNTNSNE